MYFQSSVSRSDLADAKTAHISEDKIYTMLMELEPHKATGLDGLQVKFLIDSAQSIFLNFNTYN